MSSKFSDTVNKFAEQFGIDALTIVQKTAFDIHAQLVDGTPRDTGRAASSWNLTKDTVSLKTIPKRKKYTNLKPYVNANITALDYKKKSVTFYISNNLSYIVPLSRGHSEQAPNGWIERVISNYQNYLQRQVSNASS